MKKLNLKLDGKKMLSKEEMKKISGGIWCEISCYWNNGGDPELRWSQSFNTQPGGASALLYCREALYLGYYYSSFEEVSSPMSVFTYCY